MGLSSAETRIVNAKGQLRDTQVRWVGPPSVFRCCSLGAVFVNASTHEDLWETTKVAEQHERARHTEPNSLARRRIVRLPDMLILVSCPVDNGQEQQMRVHY